MPMDKHADAQRLARSVTNVSTTATIKPYQTVVRIITTGTYTLTLPSAAEAFGYGPYFVEVIGCTGSYTIADTTAAASFSLVLTDGADRCALESSGRHWYKNSVVTV